MSEPDASGAQRDEEQREGEQPAPAFGAPEPWERWETVLCLGSAATGLAALTLLGLVVNLWLL